MNAKIWLKRRLRKIAALSKRAESSNPPTDQQHIAWLRASPFFDAAWYLDRYPDVADANADPVIHYLRHGAGEGRDPSPSFSTTYYLQANPDVANAGINPLVHFVEHGEREGRLAHRSHVPHTGSINVLRGDSFAHFSLHSASDIRAHMERTTTPADQIAHVSAHAYSPLISIIVPIYNTPTRFFWEMAHSVLSQRYTRWELCLVDDGSSSELTQIAMTDIAVLGDPRIRITRLESNVGIAKATHSGLLAATGDYVALLDHDDLLTPDALAEIVALLRTEPELDYIYTDHSIVDVNGTLKHFARKPACSPEFLLSTNYIVHFKVVRRDFLIDIGGTEDDTPNVQDLEMSLKLLRAGARTRYLPKICYLWRDHAGSVASGSAAKDGIERLLVAAYDNHLREIGVQVRQSWPRVYRTGRVGVFKLDFSVRATPSATIVVRMRTGGDGNETRTRILNLCGGRYHVHLATFEETDTKTGVLALGAADAAQAFYASLVTQAVIFVDEAAHDLGNDWAKELLGYLQLDTMIGAVGGKVLNEYLRVKAGGMLLGDDGHYSTVCGGEFDDRNGHWFLGQIASNVDAVSARFMATRTDLLVKYGGPPFAKMGDTAGIAYSAALRRDGLRIVYNPWAKVYDAARMSLPGAASSFIERTGREMLDIRCYPSTGRASIASGDQTAEPLDRR